METLVVCLMESGGHATAFGPFNQREASRFVEHWKAEGFAVTTAHLNTTRCLEFGVKRNKDQP